VVEKAVVERIVDGEHAVLHMGDDEVERIVPVSSLPDGAEEGTWLMVRFSDGELTEARIDTEETRSRRERISRKMDRLRRRGR